MELASCRDRGYRRNDGDVQVRVRQMTFALPRSVVMFLVLAALYRGLQKRMERQGRAIFNS